MLSISLSSTSGSSSRGPRLTGKVTSSRTGYKAHTGHTQYDSRRGLLRAP
jgi:hypothetical protein